MATRRAAHGMSPARWRRPYRSRWPQRRMADGLSIKEVAEQTGLAAGTIRMWEQRYGFPEPAAHRLGLPPLRRPTTSRRCAARRPTASAACRCPPRSSARARPAATTDHPSIYAAVAATDHGARPQVLRKSTLVALVAGDRARDARARRRAGAVRRLPARALLPRGRAALPPAWRATPTPPTVFADFAALRRPSGAPVEVPIAEGDALGQRVGGRSSTRPATRRACWPGSSPARSSPAARTTSTGASRRSGPSTRARPAAPRRRPRGWPAAPTPRTARGSRSCWPTARWRMEEPAPALTALTNRMVAYLEAACGARRSSTTTWSPGERAALAARSRSRSRRRRASS